MPAVSALTPVDPTTLSTSEREEKSAWLVRKLVGSMMGRIALASFESIRASSPVVATGGTAAFAAPLMGPVTDVVVGGFGGSLFVELGTVMAWDVGNKVATDLLFGKVAKASIPEHSKRLTTTSVKALTATIKYQHSPTDAALGFFRASYIVRKDPSLFSSISDFLSSQKGWFSPYLQSTARRPVIPREVNPNVIFSHGPFLAGDYALATRLASESATIISLVNSTTPNTSPLVVPESGTLPITPPRNLLMTVVGLAPHRLGIWTSSARPGESVIKYLLLNRCPAIILPVLPGSPMIAWNTLKLQTLHTYVHELDGDGNITPNSKKFEGAVDSLFEFASLCVDWERLRTPSSANSISTDHTNESSAAKRLVRDAIALVVEGAIRSGLPASMKVLAKEVDLARAGIEMWRTP